MKRIFSIAMSAALLLGLGSCSKELDNTAGDDNGAAAVQFSIKTVKGNLMTYADIAQGAEWTVGSVNIYLFDATTGTALGDKSNFDYDATAKVFTAKSAWLTTNKGKKVNVYFVGNDDTANLFGNTTHVGTVTNEAAFIEKLSIAQTLTGGKANLLTTPLLFSAYELGVQVPNLGKLSVPVTLKRREARFDIVNTDKANFTVTKVLVSDAKRQGFIFGNATTTPTLPVASLKEITTFPAYDATDATLMPSVFYMYPTQLGTGKTEIVVLGTYKGVDQEFKVNSTAQIEANKRYKLVFNAAELDFDLVVADYDEGPELPVDPFEGSGTLSITSLTGGLGSFSGSTYSLTPDPAVQILTVTLGVPSKAGVTAAVTSVAGATVIATPGTDITSTTPTVTYGIGHQQVFTIKVNYTTWTKDDKTVITFTDANDSSNTTDLTLWAVYNVGDYYPNPSGASAIGVVAWVDPANPDKGKVLRALNTSTTKWNSSYSATGANDQYNGRKNMQTIQAINSDLSFYQAFYSAHVLNPPTTVYTPSIEGVWYLPAYRELYEYINTTAIVEIFDKLVASGLSTHDYAKLGDLGSFSSAREYVTSTEYDIINAYVWQIDYNPPYSPIYNSWNVRDKAGNMGVCVMLAY